MQENGRGLALSVLGTRALPGEALFFLGTHGVVIFETCYRMFRHHGDLVNLNSRVGDYGDCQRKCGDGGLLLALLISFVLCHSWIFYGWGKCLTMPDPMAFDPRMVSGQSRSMTIKSCKRHQCSSNVKASSSFAIASRDIAIPQIERRMSWKPANQGGILGNS